MTRRCEGSCVYKSYSDDLGRPAGRLCGQCGDRVIETTPKKCGNTRCSVSTGIHDGLTFGSGDLDDYGYWTKPCAPCARAWEVAHPEDGDCWPFGKKETPNAP